MAKQKIRKRSKSFPLSCREPRRNYFFKHAGKQIYLGTDADRALEKYHECQADIAAGKPPRHQKQRKEQEAPIREPDEMTLRQAFDLRLADLERRAGGGTVQTMAKTFRILIQCAGGNKPVAELTPRDFDRYMAYLRRNYTVQSVKYRYSNVASAFNWLKRGGYIADAPAYGNEFRSPADDEIRAEKQQTKREKGDRHYSPKEIRRLLEVAETHLQRCCVLLGANAGFCQTDMSKLVHADIVDSWFDAFSVR